MKKACLSVLLLVLSLGIGLVMCEIGLRLTHYQPRTIVVEPEIPLADRFFLPDPELVYRLDYEPFNNPLPPDVQSRDARLQFRPDYRPNSDLTDRTFVILMLGDSFTYGHGVNNEATMPYQVEKILNEEGYDVNIINAGVPGYGIDQEYTYALRLLPLIQPDLVVVNAHPTDVHDDNDNCLFKRQGQQWAPVSAQWSFEYLQLRAVTTLPQPILTSHLGNVALSSLNERYNPACSLDKTRFIPAEMIAKSVYLLTDLEQRLTQNHSQLMVTLGAFQAFHDPDLGINTEYLVSLYRQQRQVLSETFSLVDANLALVAAERSLAFQPLVTPPLSSASTEVASPSGQVAGATTSNRFTEFFNSPVVEVDSQPGHIHLNQVGNSVFAHAIADRIKGTYHVPHFSPFTR